MEGIMVGNVVIIPRWGGGSGHRAGFPEENHP